MLLAAQFVTVFVLGFGTGGAWSLWYRDVNRSLLWIGVGVDVLYAMYLIVAYVVLP